MAPWTVARINRAKMTVVGQNNTPEPKKIPTSITIVATIETDGTMDIAIVRQVQLTFTNKVKMTVVGRDNTPEQRKIHTCTITIPIIEMDGIMDIAIATKKHFSCAYA